MSLEASTPMSTLSGDRARMMTASCGSAVAPGAKYMLLDDRNVIDSTAAFVLGCAARPLTPAPICCSWFRFASPRMSPRGHVHGGFRAVEKDDRSPMIKEEREYEMRFDNMQVCLGRLGRRRRRRRRRRRCCHRCLLLPAVLLRRLLPATRCTRRPALLCPVLDCHPALPPPAERVARPGPAARPEEGAA